MCISLKILSIFSCTCWPLYVFQEKRFIQSFSPYFNQIVWGCLLLSCMSSVYVLYIKPLSNTQFTDIFSHSTDCLYILIVSFAVQNLSMLMYSQLQIFKYFYFILYKKPFIYLFIYFWLCWVLVVACRIFCCSAQASLQLWREGSRATWALWLQHTGSLVVACGHSCLVACGILAPHPEIEPTSSALEGGFLTTVPPGKSSSCQFLHLQIMLLVVQPKKLLPILMSRSLFSSRSFTI